MKAIHNNSYNPLLNPDVVTNPKVTEYESNSQPKIGNDVADISCY